MRSLAVWTTTAAVALLGVANAQTPPAASEASASGGDVQSAVTAYAAYQSDVSELRAAEIRNANDLETALDRVARHNRDALTRGWIAYGASTAAQSPAFVQGVRDAAAYYGRDAVIWAITADPAYARGLRGGTEATRLLLDSANADAARIIAVADRYQEMAYSMQRQRWANAVAPAQAARVQRVRALSVAGAPASAVPSEVSPRLSVAVLSLSPGSDPTAYGGRRFWDALRGGPDVVAVSSNPVTYQWRVNVTRGEALDRMASVAALQALDAVDSNQSAVSRLISDPRSRDCFEMAQLQLYQCMSAARFRYENAFCLGQHGLRDMGTCIGAVAQPDATAMSPMPAAARGGRE
jgi:hypothetical protein